MRRTDGYVERSACREGEWFGQDGHGRWLPRIDRELCRELAGEGVITRKC